MTIHIYAEHLLNIRTLTIQVSLTTPSNAGTKATISADGGTLSVSHEGETASITLPVIIAGESGKALQIPAVSTSDLSFRLRLDDGAGALQTGQSGETIIPWTAASLSDQLELQCKKCNAVVLPRAQIQTWKDLPSEGWAEMMEFWHCHKPNEPHDHDHQTDKKGYSADSSLAITPSVGLVNATNFILAAEDCENIKVCNRSGSTTSEHDLLCSSCSAIVGVLDKPAQSYKLAKLALSISPSQGQPQSFDKPKWLSCHLLNSMDNQGLRKFIVTSGDNSPNALLVWLFTPDVRVSSSESLTPEPARVAKILWKQTPAERQQALLDTQSLSEGEMELPFFELQALQRALEDSAALLPENARRFQDWNTALLHRFNSEDASFD